MMSGIALARPGLQTAERLIRRADAALYRAKDAGRTTFAVATTTGDPPCSAPPRHPVTPSCLSPRPDAQPTRPARDDDAPSSRATHPDQRHTC